MHIIRTFMIGGALAVSVGAAEASYRQFRDVEASCSYGAACDIQMAAAGGDVYGFGLSRKTGPDAPLSLFLSTGADLRTATTAAFAVDGKTVLSLPAEAFSRNEDRQRSVHEGGDVLTLLDAMRNGKALTVTFSDSREKPSRFSLSGLVAGLIFVDEEQGRVDATDALQTKGPKRSVVPDIRDILSLEDIPESIRPDFTAPDGGCSFMDEKRFSYVGGFDAGVGDGFRLLGLPCAEGGAYNQPYVFYVEREGAAKALALPTIVEAGASTTAQAWNIDWDFKTRMVTAFFKGRGIGDCGSYDRWRLDDLGEGPVFVLIESRSKDDCDGDDAGGVENWPADWPPARQ